MGIMNHIKVLNIVGARPNFMKIAPLMEAMGAEAGFEARLVHTGQHYDEAMSRLFFEHLEIPRPDVDLEVGSGSHAQQTAEIMRRFEPVLLEFEPHLVVVVGDVNSTIACSLVAAKLGVKVAHVEAGLRSFDRRMPEEINRVLTDSIADFLFTTEPSARENLLREGIPAGKIFFAGNVMIDTLLKNKAKAAASPVLSDLGLIDASGRISGYMLVTLHRPSNVDDRETLERILAALSRLSQELPIFLPIHPRTRKMIQQFGLTHYFKSVAPGFIPGQAGDKPPRYVQADRGIYWLDPLGYLDFLLLMSRARLVLTDSGGIQEETTVLGIPCLTMRENTERPITVTQGTNVLIGNDPIRIVDEGLRRLSGQAKSGRIPEKWDGLAARRIVKILKERLI